jgi:hypothetical protein
MRGGSAQFVTSKKTAPARGQEIIDYPLFLNMGFVERKVR